MKPLSALLLCTFVSRLPRRALPAEPEDALSSTRLGKRRPGPEGVSVLRP